MSDDEKKMINYFFAAANIVLFISVFPMFISLRRNKDNIRGLSFNGALLTIIGIVFVNMGYLSYNLYANMVLSWPLIFYWTMVAYYTSNKIKKKKGDDEIIDKLKLEVIKECKMKNRH